ncbi:unnamed protein product [Larinioides sclopetarius]|uniref:NADH dehydrogenase subunit 4 n=1 Tax=Larinioides sclopetarius TaxID=280406 RepID=A0AAV1ZLJ8_9ARAC
MPLICWLMWLALISKTISLVSPSVII